jgi:hypothetical protein
MVRRIRLTNGSAVVINAREQAPSRAHRGINQYILLLLGVEFFVRD